MLLSGLPVALLDQLQILLRNANPRLRFLLEAVKHVHRFLKLDGVDRSVRVRVEVLQDLQYAGPPKSLKRFRASMLLAVLRLPQGESDFPTRIFREPKKILQGRPKPHDLFEIGHYG